MPNSRETNDIEGDLKSFENIVDNLRALLKRAHENVTKERNRANDLEKKLKKCAKNLEVTPKLKRQPLIRHSKFPAKATDEALKAKDGEIKELQTSQAVLEKINEENQQIIDNLRKDVRQLNLELGTQRFLSGNSDDLEEIHKIYNYELLKLDEELKELKQREGDWPKVRMVYEEEIENLHEQIEELEAGSYDLNGKLRKSEEEINRLSLALHKKRNSGNDRILFSGSAGLLMAGTLNESDFDFIVQDNVNALRDSHARELGRGKYWNGNRRCSEEDDIKTPFNQEEYIRDLESENQKNLEELEYLRNRIEANRDYEDRDLLDDIQNLKVEHETEVRILNDQIEKLRSRENGDIWQEVEDLKKEHEREVNRLRGEIEEMRFFEDEDISKEVEQLKRHHLREVESLREEIEMFRANNNHGDVFEEVESLKRNHFDEVEVLKKEIATLKNQEPGFGQDNAEGLLSDDLKYQKEGFQNINPEKEWALLLNAKEKELDSLKNELAFLKDEDNSYKTEAANQNPEDLQLMSNEIQRLNRIIQHMSRNTIPEYSKTKNDIQTSNIDPVSDSPSKELQTLNLVNDEASRAEIEREYQEKMESFQAEIFALKNLEVKQIWEDAEANVDKELEIIKKDFLAMSNAKSADEWERSMKLYEEIRRLKSELLAKNNLESDEIGRLHEEVRFLKKELSNARRNNENFVTSDNIDRVSCNPQNSSQASLARSNKNYVPSVKGNEDEEIWNLEIRPLLEDIAILNNRIKEIEESASSEKIKLQNEIDSLQKENCELKRQTGNEDSGDVCVQGSERTYTDDEKLARILQELGDVQKLQEESDKKAADYERQLEEERRRHEKELKMMVNDLQSLRGSIDESEAEKADSLEEKEEQIRKLGNELEEVRGQHEREIQAIGEMCKEKTDALDEKISDLKISLGSRENDLTKRLQEIEELLAKIEGLEEEIEGLKEENQNKAKEIDDRDETIQELRFQLEECKTAVDKTLREKEKTYALYQAELGRVHIELLTTKSSNEEFVRDVEASNKRHAEEMVRQREQLEEKFECLVLELKKLHEDEIDQIRIEMLSEQDRFKEYIQRMRNRQLSNESAELCEGDLGISSFDSEEQKTRNRMQSENIKERVSRSKSDSDIFGDGFRSGERDDDEEAMPGTNTFENPDGAEKGRRASQIHPFLGRKPSHNERMTQSLDEIDGPDGGGGPRRDERNKFKNKKKQSKTKRKPRDLPANVGTDEENVDEIELKDKQKQCRQQ